MIECIGDLRKNVLAGEAAGYGQYGLDLKEKKGFKG